MKSIDLSYGYNSNEQIEVPHESGGTIQVWTKQHNKVPHGAQYVDLNPNGTLCMFYRVKIVQINNGTTRRCLEYLSSFNVWTPSSYSETELLAREEIRQILQP